MSYVTNLLEQRGRLEHHEIDELKSWLEVLKADCETLGETPEDTERMGRIAARIKKEESRAAVSED